VLEEQDDQIKIEASCVIQTNQKRITLEQTTNYGIFRDGRILVSNRIRPKDSIRNITTLPRIGLSFQLNPAFHKIQHFGRGPHENYPDRKSGSQIGLWKTSPSEMGFNYIVPSENGSRSDCKWISFDSGDGGMVVVADFDSSFSCSALLHSADELHHALHTCDLDVRENAMHPIHVNIDHKLLGVGGDVR
jgi:beta-galactosidase